MNIFNKKNIKLSNVDKILIIIITLLIVFNFTNWFCNILGIGIDCSIREGKSKRQRRSEAGKTTKAYKKKQKKIRGLRSELEEAREDKKEAEDNLQTVKDRKDAKYKVLEDDVNNLDEVYSIIEDEIMAGSNFYSALGSNGDLNTDLTGVTDEYSKDMYQTSYVSSRTTDYSVDGDDIFTVNDLISKIGDFFTSIDNNTGYTNAI